MPTKKDEMLQHLSLDCTQFKNRFRCKKEKKIYNKPFFVVRASHLYNHMNALNALYINRKFIELIKVP